MEGWIKIHRKLLEWEWYNDTNTFRLFIHFLLKANHKDKNYRGLKIKRGFLITGFDLLSRETGLSIQQIRTAIKKLKSTNEITIKTSSQGSVIQIVKYDNYQVATSGATNEQQTSNKRATTNKNEKKEKNENKYREFNHLSLSFEEFEILNKTYSKSQIDNIIDSIENFKQNTKYKSLFITSRNWLKREYPMQEKKQDKINNFINNL